MSDTYSDTCNCGNCRATRITDSAHHDTLSMGRDLTIAEGDRCYALYLLKEAQEIMENFDKSRITSWTNNFLEFKEHADAKNQEIKNAGK